MAWQQLSCRTTKASQEKIVQHLEVFGALSVTFQDADDQPVLEPLPGKTPLWQTLNITALYQHEQDLSLLVASLANQPCDAVKLDFLPDKDWQREWMKDYHPMRFGQKLWIYPSQERLPDDDCVKIRLDPGLAFGSGTHPTTALCLQWLDAYVYEQAQSLSGKSVIDYGCGSGVLAIAALKLGAEHVIACDIDEQALIATRDNCQRNGIDKQRITTCSPEQMPQYRVDVLLANILAGPLLTLAPSLCARLKTKGHLIISGILKNQADRILEAYSPMIRHLDITSSAEWLRLTGIAK